MIRVSQLESVRPTAPRHPVGGYSPTHSDQKNVKTRAYSPFRVPNCDNPKPDKSGRNTRGGVQNGPLIINDLRNTFRTPVRSRSWKNSKPLVTVRPVNDHLTTVCGNP